MNWFVRGIYFVASLLFVRWIARIPGWVLLLGAFLSVVGIIIFGLIR